MSKLGKIMLITVTLAILRKLVVTRKKKSETPVQIIEREVPQLLSVRRN